MSGKILPRVFISDLEDFRRLAQIKSAIPPHIGRFYQHIAQGFADHGIAIDRHQQRALDDIPEIADVEF